MEIRDYLRMLRRGWAAIVLIAALFVGLASLYVAVAPKVYQSGAVLFVSGEEPQSTSDLQAGNSFALSAVITYGKIIDSDAVLGPASVALHPSVSVEDLLAAVDVVVPEDTTLIVINATAQTPDQAAAIANAVTDSATRVIPTLQVNNVGRPLIQMQQLRPAVPPQAALSPNVKRILALGLVVGVCTGLALTIAAQTLDTRIRRAEDIREFTDVPLLAEIPHAKRGNVGVAVRDDPTGLAGEAFRTLRTNLGFMEPRDRHSLVFAAVSEDRGGAQVPINLAWSLARAGWGVLLVDLDLRRSTVAATLGVKADRGLSDVLMGQRSLAEVVNETTEPRLRVVTSGTPQASPSDLLTGPTMNSLLRAMEHEYDYVILHAPPLLSYTDAALVSRAAGGSFVTVAAGRTRSQDLTTALNALANVRIKPMGLVLTGTRRIEGLAGLVHSGTTKRQQPGVPVIRQSLDGSSGAAQSRDTQRKFSPPAADPTLRIMHQSESGRPPTHSAPGSRSVSPGATSPVPGRPRVEQPRGSSPSSHTAKPRHSEPDALETPHRDRINGTGSIDEHAQPRSKDTHGQAPPRPLGRPAR